MKHWMLWVVALSFSLFAGQVISDDQLDSKAKPVVVKTDAPKLAEGAKADSAAPEQPLTQPEAAVVKQNAVNVRGQAAINSEVVTHLKKDEQVMILEEITLKKPKLDEPAKWYRIALPSSCAVWVNANYIDGATKTVKPKRLNLRSGPGENYSVLGRIEQGTVVKEIEAKGDWLKIEAPAQSYAFVAAHLLTRAPAAPTIAAVEPPKPATPPAETTVTPPTPVAPPVEVSPAMPVTPATPETPVTPVTPPPPPAVNVPPPVPPPSVPVPSEDVKRVISREGIVKRSVSVQAPTYFVLESLDTKRTINYLYSSSTNILLKDFRGKRIIVTGEESLDERWPNTPVLTVETLQPVE